MSENFLEVKLPIFSSSSRSQCGNSIGNMVIDIQHKLSMLVEIAFLKELVGGLARPPESPIEL